MSLFQRILFKVKANRLLPVFWITLLSILVILLFSPWTSAINPYTLYDPSVYAVIGKAWAYTDLLPYRDFFDHKGPLVYLYYTLGTLIYQGNIKVGISIIQTIFLSSSLCILYRTIMMFHGKKEAWIIILSFLIFYITHIEGGGNTEEMSMPFMLLPLYILLRDIKADRLKIGGSPSTCSLLILGACMGVHILIRVTNAASLCACLLVYTVAYIRFCQWKTITRILLISGTGCVFLLLPFMVYLFSKNLLQDYIQSNFVFNFQYASHQNSIAQVTRQALNCPYIVALPVCCCLNRFLKAVGLWKELTYTIVGACSFLVILIGHCYPHYLLLSAPGYVCSGLFCCDIAKHPVSRYKIGLVMLIATVWAHPHVALFSLAKAQLRDSACLFLLSHEQLAAKISKDWFGPQANQLTETNVRRKFQALERMRRQIEIPQRALRDIACIIPDKDRNSVLVYGGFGTEYLTLDIWPCCKYFILQDPLASHDKSGKLAATIKQAISQSSPKWIVIRKEHTRKGSPIYHYTADNYEKVLEDDNYELYHIKN